jgi:hypothetical protein
MRLSRPSAVLAITAAGALMSACTAAPTASASPNALLGELAGLSGVVDASVFGDGQPDEFRSIVVTVAEQASDDTVVAAAEQAADLAESARWPGELDVTREQVDAFDEAADMPNPAPWSLTVYPDETDTAGPVLRGLLEVERMPGVASVSVSDGWPSVTVDDPAVFPAVFDQVSVAALFDEGGTFRTAGDDDHLRIVSVPERTSTSAVHAIIDIAGQYPSAEVLLEATTYGPQWPELYIARLSAEEAASVQTRLLDPALATADIDGFAVPFILTTTTTTGPQYLTGNLGGLPDDAGEG